MNRESRQSLCLPPPNFKPVKSVTAAWFVQPPSFDTGKRRLGKGARASGVRYERIAQQRLGERYGDSYLPSPWLRFVADGTLRMCQPDGLLFNFRKGQITVFEIKLKHTPDAFYQLMRLYIPVLAFMFPRELWDIRCCEIVKWYDPHVQFPHPTQLRQYPEDSEAGFVGIHILGVR